MRPILFLSVLVFMLTACGASKNKMATKESLKPMKMELRDNLDYEECDCNASLNYAPDLKYPSHSPMKYLRMNFQIMNSEDGKQNMTEERGDWFMKELIRSCNKRLNNNITMNLPADNTTPTLPINIQFVRQGRVGKANDDGIYYNYDDELYYFVSSGKNKNNYSKEVIKKYAVNEDFVLNAFIMVTHPDSIKSKTYKTHGSGIALGNSLKVIGIHEKNLEPYHISGIFNHEVGHCLGLRHTWSGNDGCDDTPNHANCWDNQSCRSPKGRASNNMMDYNNDQRAVTPCQIGRMHKNFATVGARQRKMLIANWCKLDPEKHIYITDKVHWKGAKDLEGNLTIREGGTLKISCRTSIPKNGKIVVEPGGQLILDGCKLHNACGDKWKGIELMSRGNKSGEVLYLGDTIIEDTPNFDGAL